MLLVTGGLPRRIYCSTSCKQPCCQALAAFLFTTLACIHRVLLCFLLPAATSCRTIPFLNELLYVQPTLLAAGLLFVTEVLRPGLPAIQRRTIIGAACCFLVTPPLLLVNPLLCQYARSAGGCWFDATQLYFLGCNAAMMLIGRYVRLQEREAAAAAVGDLAKKSA